MRLHDKTKYLEEGAEAGVGTAAELVARWYTVSEPYVVLVPTVSPAVEIWCPAIAHKIEAQRRGVGGVKLEDRHLRRARYSVFALASTALRSRPRVQDPPEEAECPVSALRRHSASTRALFLHWRVGTPEWSTENDHIITDG